MGLLSRRDCSNRVLGGQNSTQLRLRKHSYRFAEQVLNSKLSLKEEIEKTKENLDPDPTDLSRPKFNELLRTRFVSLDWKDQPRVFKDEDNPSARMDFLKERVGIEVGFGHSSFLGIDLLKFQICSYSGLDQIDVGVYIVTTGKFQKDVQRQYQQNWEGSLKFEKLIRYLPHLRSAITIPVYVLGIDT